MMFSLFSIIFVLAFLLVGAAFIGILIFVLVRWGRNNASPVLTVDATVVSRRENMRTYQNSSTGDMPMTTHSTTYYATFEVPSGSRMEFAVPGTEYGMLAQGDRGRLTFQGTRYLGFERTITQ